MKAAARFIAWPSACAAQPRSASARVAIPPAVSPARDRRAAADRKASARAGPSSASSRLRLTVFPFGDLLFGVVLRAPIALLDLAHQLVALAGELVELVIGEFAPALFQRALHLLPVARDAIP